MRTFGTSFYRVFFRELETGYSCTCAENNKKLKLKGRLRLCLKLIDQSKQEEGEQDQLCR